MLDEISFEHTNRLRERFFPTALNQVPAHITLFHHLPGSETAEITDQLEHQCCNFAPFSLQVSGLQHLGRGVAYRISSEDLLRLHRHLAQSFSPWLTRQDQQKYRPHLTIQNKVSPAESKELLSQLEAQFAPFQMTAVGLHLWQYLNGPWQLFQTFRFSKQPE